MNRDNGIWKEFESEKENKILGVIEMENDIVRINFEFLNNKARNYLLYNELDPTNYFFDKVSNTNNILAKDKYEVHVIKLLKLCKLDEYDTAVRYLDQFIFGVGLVRSIK